MRSEVTLREETLKRSPLILDKTRQHLTIHVLCEIEFCRPAKNLLISNFEKSHCILLNERRAYNSLTQMYIM